MNETPSLKVAIMGIADRFNKLIPIMLQMGIVEDLLNKKLVLSERDGASYTVTINSDGMSVSDGSDPFSHARLCTTGEQWQKILAGEKLDRCTKTALTDPQRSELYDAATSIEQMKSIRQFTSML